MFDKCERGIAINFLSDLSDGKRDPDMMYVTSNDISKAIDGITTKFTIRHDYRPNDCTVYLYK